MKLFSNHSMLLQAKDAAFQPKFGIQILLFLLVFAVSSALSSIIISIPILYRLFVDYDVVGRAMEGVVISTESLTANLMNDPVVMLISLFATAITILCVIFFCRKVEKRSYVSMGFAKKGWLTSYVKGFAIGTALLFICAGIGYLTGSLQFAFSEKIAVGYILLFLLGFLIQGASEELMLRSYFMVSLANSCKLPVAVGISSVVFSLLHLENPGFGLLPFINIALFGIFMAVYVLRTENIWGACAVHSAWNFMQGNILGIQVSGTGSLPSVAVMEPVSGQKLLNGGSFGLEGGLIVTAVLICAILVVLFVAAKKNAPITEE